MSELQRNKSLYGLLAEGEVAVPDYQRDYAQGRVEDKKVEDTRVRFVEDLVKASGEGEHVAHMGLVYGSGNRMFDGFVAVDGQQRLTTAFLFHLYLAKMCDDAAVLDALSRFGWHGRVYASEFLEFLLAEPMPGGSVERISSWIHGSPRYFSIWERDPTVRGMVVMLDEIHRQLAPENKTSLAGRLMELKSEKCRVVFDYLRLEDGTDELQYLKMNSRGRDLTTYELFKQKFQSESRLPESLIDKMDNRWLWFMDERASRNEVPVGAGSLAEPDLFYQNFINELTLWMAIKHDEAYPSLIDDIVGSKLKGNRTDTGFVPFNAYAVLQHNPAEFERTFDWVVDNYDVLSAIVDGFCYAGQHARTDHIFLDPSWPVRYWFAAILRFAELTDYARVDGSLFKRWWRPIHNLTSNSNPGSENYPQLIRSMESLDLDMLRFLTDHLEPLPAFNGEQWREEVYKAHCICRDEAFTDEFTRQEHRRRFQGRIRLLLPDDECRCLNIDRFRLFAAGFDRLVSDRYDDKASDFDFVKALISFDFHTEGYVRPHQVKLKFQNGHMRDGWVAVRLKRMLMRYVECGSPANVPAFLSECVNDWRREIRSKSYMERYELSWIGYFYEQEALCREAYLDSDYGRLMNKNKGQLCNSVWLYKKTNSNDGDLLLSNRRHEVIGRLINPDMARSETDLGYEIVLDLPAYPGLVAGFTPWRIWVGVRKTDSRFRVPCINRAKGYASSDNYAVWRWFPEDETQCFYEAEQEPLGTYLDRLKERFDAFCREFIVDISAPSGGIEG